jgi:hypothetical protein
VRADWIVLNCLTNNLECKRCGATETAVFGVAIKEFVKTTEAFSKRHRGCKEKK